MRIETLLTKDDLAERYAGRVDRVGFSPVENADDAAALRSILHDLQGSPGVR